MFRRRTRWILLVIFGAAAACLTVYIIDLHRGEDARIDRLPHYKTITVYDVIPWRRDGRSLDTIASAQIDEESTRIIVQDVTYHRPLVVKYMGGYLANVKLDDGSTERITISFYGGFFTVLGKGGYFQTEGKSRAKLEECMSKVKKHWRLNDQDQGGSTRSAAPSTNPSNKPNGS